MPTNLPPRRATTVPSTETPLQTFVWRFGVLIFLLAGLFITIETGAYPAPCEFPELLMSP
jgi:hypothetical protein